MKDCSAEGGHHRKGLLSDSQNTRILQIPESLGDRPWVNPPLHPCKKKGKKKRNPEKNVSDLPITVNMDDNHGEGVNTQVTVYPVGLIVG